MAKTPADLAVMREFGERVLAARNAMELSQEKLAERAGMDRTTVGKIERGIGNPTLLKINKLALVLEDGFAGFLPCRPANPGK